jgi:hypothetical protein
VQEENLSIRRQVLGADHPDTLIAQGNLAHTLSSMGELQRAGNRNGLQDSAREE